MTTSQTILFYSDFKPGVSTAVDNRLLDLLDGSDHSVFYIPSDSDPKRRYFQRVVENYNEIGITDVTYFDLNSEFNPSLTEQMLKSSAIHLSGGDPLVFLSHIRSRNFGPILKKYWQAGGILVGISAGAMLLGKSIGTLELEPSKPEVKKACKPLGFVDVEFFPHFDGDSRVLKALCEYSRRHSHKIYACSDSEGVIFRNGTTEFVGDVVQIQLGKVLSG